MEKSAIRQGWDFMAEILGADMSANGAYQDFSNEVAVNNQIGLDVNRQNAAIDEHVQLINAEIEKLNDSINNHPHIGNTIDTLKGYVAEEWHAGTFNIDALKKGSTYQAKALHSNGYASVDIQVKNGDSIIGQYSLKHCDDVKRAENAQAVLSENSSIPKYNNQKRLIAFEQVEDAKSIAAKREESNAIKRPHVANAHLNTKNNLVGIVEEDGIKSKKLSVEESKEIAREAKKKEFAPEKHGIVKEEAKHINFEDVKFQEDYLNKAFEAGLTAAAISAITQMVPELYKAIDYLIKNGEINIQQLKDSGKKVISASGESFLRGSIAYGLELAIQQGVLGEAMKGVSPTIVGTMVTIVMGTIKNSILVAAGKMTAKEMGMKFVDTVVISSGYLVAMKVGGVIAQAIAPQLPGLAYAIGSLIGCSIAVVYNIGKKKLISFCVDTGFTCFGLVEQNYELPESMLDEMGIKTANVSRAQVNRTGVNVSNVQQNVDRTNYETVEMTMVKRGVIDINKIGYVV